MVYHIVLHVLNYHELRVALLAALAPLINYRNIAEKACAKCST